MKAIIVAAMIGVASFVGATGTLSWATGASGVDAGGLAIPSGWFCALVWDVNQVGVGQTGFSFNRSTIVSTDKGLVLLDVSTTAAGRVNVSRSGVAWGSSFQNTSIPSPWTTTPVMPPLAATDPNNDYYIVVFNNSDYTKADKVAYKFINDKASPVGANNNLSIAGTTFAAGDWQSVPEPTTLALFGLGAGVLALRSKFRKNV